jgi:hypothetical protein
MPARRPRHATVVAYLALFVALSGTSFAIGRSTASTSESKPVARPSLANTATKPGKIARAGSPAATAARRGRRGPRGPRGPRGRPGATNAIVRYVTVSSAQGRYGLTGAQASCAPGETATGGGFLSGSQQSIVNSFPVLTGTKPTGWEANFGAYTPGREVYVVCVSR